MVSDQATSEPAPEPRPGPDRDALRLGPLDEVGDDQEVAGEAHPDDHVDLELEAVGVDLPLLVREILVVRQPRREAGARVLGEQPRLAFEVAGEARQDRLALGRREGAALRDDEGVGGRLGQVGEQLLHHRRRLDERLGARARPLRAVEMARMGDAQHRVVRGVHVRIAEIRRVGRDQRQVERVGELDQGVLRRVLDRVAAARQLDVEPAGNSEASRSSMSSARSCRPSARSRVTAPSPAPVSAISPSVRPSRSSSATCGSSSSGRSRCARLTRWHRFCQPASSWA